MVKLDEHPLMKKLADPGIQLTPKGRILGNYILNNPRKAVFMTTKELAGICKVSEATVVRFVTQVGFESYGRFQQTLRDLIDTDMPLTERMDLTFSGDPDTNRFQYEIYKDIENLKHLYESTDTGVMKKIIDCLAESAGIYIIGSRMSYPLAHYMGWAMTKIRQNVQTLNGSDSTSFDYLAIAAPESAVIIFTVSRYPNELLRLGKHVRRTGHKLIVISDNALAPLNNFAHLNLAAPSRFIPLFSSPISMMCLINYLLTELAGRYGDNMNKHQQKLEQTYRENDILFNLDNFLK
ncbi:Sugar isomerase domain-containing protein [Desulfonema limicola]|uniref:Sugar isomerase domain-containing protein n=1 Tax=Desulfonema limicola TaxID=45656 RepID=A0A975B928_9BACT|nr:MurR/RpiR family transcriptional regulator [Desulfonema limicola]QTA80931.1 Sugar isomerase domain-containing protein [Desulfonema limicola]